MKYKDKTKEQLINESAELYQRTEDLEAREIEHNKTEFARNVSIVDHEISIVIWDNI